MKSDKTKVGVLFVHPSGIDLLAGNLNTEKELNFKWKNKKLTYVFEKIPQESSFFDLKKPLFLVYFDEKQTRDLTPESIKFFSLRKNQPSLSYSVLTKLSEFSRIEGMNDAVVPPKKDKLNMLLLIAIAALILGMVVLIWLGLSQVNLLETLTTSLKGASTFVSGSGT